jgi:polyferredoxin
MNESELKKTKYEKKCQKCNADIGGKSYYVVQLDCIYDGNSLTACNRVVVCSNCYSHLMSWLNLSQ